MVQLVKNPPAMQETTVRFPGGEHPSLEKGKVTQSGTSVFWPHKELDTPVQLSLSFQCNIM